MVNVFCDYWVQFVGNGIECFKVDIVQGWLLEEMGVGFVLFMVGIIFVVYQCVFKVIIDDYYGDIFWYGNCFGVECMVINQ